MDKTPTESYDSNLTRIDQDPLVCQRLDIDVELFEINTLKKLNRIGNESDVTKVQDSVLSLAGNFDDS